MKNYLSFSFILFFVLASFALFAQYKKGVYYYNNFQYAKAIQAFEKSIRKKNPPTAAFESLADCYRLTKNYEKAETMYAKALQTGKESPLSHFYYAEVLKSNKKLDEAKVQYSIYSRFFPDDKTVENKIKSVNEAQILLNKKSEFMVSAIKNINTPNSEFGPVIFREGMVFTAERDQDLVNFERYQWNGSPFLNLFYAERKDIKDSLTFNTPKGFSKRLNSDSHDGPATFNAGNNLVFFTRVETKNRKDKSFINRAKIYSSELKNGNWTKPKPFFLNSDEYSIAHPSVSADGSFLFFSSDMPGGFGKKDIYVCAREKDGWGKPVNLGPEVNTLGDEVFPYISKKGVLFFSSDTHPGIGGLDIFNAEKRDGKWVHVVNLGSPLNSSTDDFGICYNGNSRTGYFSSNRPGGMGSDDIYSFFESEKFISLTGKILLSKHLDDPAKNIKVFLLKEDGTRIKVSLTDNTGYFHFDNLSADEKYLVKIDESDPGFVGKKRAYLTDDKDQIVRVTVFNEKGGRFVFQNLPADPNVLSQVSAEENINISGNFFTGDDQSNPLANTKVNLLNGKGEVVQTVSTNSFGAFVFSDLPPNENYIVKIDDSNVTLAEGIKIMMTNKSGKEIGKTTTGSHGEFKFEFLASQKSVLEQMLVEESELLYDMSGKISSGNNKNLSGLKLRLLNEKGETIQTINMDENGNFIFTRLPASQSFLVKVEEGDTRLEGVDKLFLIDENGKVIKEMEVFKGNFSFNLLSSEYTTLGKLYVDDPWLKALSLGIDEEKKKKKSADDFEKALVITENIYYDNAAWELDSYGKGVLDKLIGIMRNDPHLKVQISSHTDSKADEKFNQELSEKRAGTAVNYIIAAGIDAKRISGKGFGESKLINKCKNGVECTEEEHAKNRRTEFNLIRQ